MQSARQGNEQMAQMLAAMREINDEGSSISRIVKVIDEIAFQTNLLALNASVEAARAGKHGKGFAVVAEEVRTLAARSARAARETADMLEATEHKVRAGSELAEKTAGALQDIVASVAQMTDIAAGIAGLSAAMGVERMRIDPAISDPVASEEVPSARDAADPPEDPPGVISVFQGLRVTPHRLLHVTMAQENSGVAVRACTMAPSARTRSFTGEVVSAPKSFLMSEPPEVGLPSI